MTAAAQALTLPTVTSGSVLPGRTVPGETVYESLPSAARLLELFPADEAALAGVERAREEIRAILDGLDDRLLVIAGPCSIHDTEAGLDYAQRLAEQARQHRSELLVVMRCYFEKPRTTVGWKGLINDPGLDGGHDIARGLREARGFLRDVGRTGLPVATEFLEPLSAPYLEDLVAWGAIGARTTESQIHRQMAAALPMPVGFKNATDGSAAPAIDACEAASGPQSFLGTDADGRVSLVSAPGNRDGHVILRGGSSGPNHRAESVVAVSEALSARGANPRLVIDASHGNSGKNHHRQAEVALEIGAQLESGPTSETIAGVMLESFLVGGAQPFDPSAGRSARDGLVRGQSITDACMDWEVTVQVLEGLAGAVRNRRAR
ncbi:3-deoxy-7-phosphoheptulonate synthase [Arthrobacter sp. NPDC090010]|uniref:3-deoxy-7-phosphoheptulonate synthase n=1 Tax=Arthrobacter sp. NPDC090010 TaxID=3363942 RepID=UPI0037FBF921